MSEKMIERRREPAADRPTPFRATPLYAFPRDHGAHGMTLRDYYAAHAPQVPPWFAWAALPEGLNITAALRQQADYNALTIQDLERLRESENDGEFILADLPQHLVPIADAANRAAFASWRERSAAEERRTADRFFAWRWHYADQMLATRGAA